MKKDRKHGLEFRAETFNILPFHLHFKPELLWDTSQAGLTKKVKILKQEIVVKTVLIFKQQTCL